MSTLMITYKGKDLNFPSSLNELTQEQFLFVASHFMNGFHKNEEELEDLNEFRLSLLHKLTGLTWPKFTNLSKDEIADMMTYTDFVFGDFDLDVCLFQKFKHKGRTYHGPDKQFERFTFLELGRADSYFVQYIQERDEESLLKLLAVLYRPKHLFSRKKKEYTDEALDSSVKALAQVDKKYLIGAMYTWWAFRENVMMKLFPIIFEKPSGKDVQVVRNDYGWDGTITTSAGIELGTIDQTGNTNWMTAFTFMAMQMERNTKK